MLNGFEMLECILILFYHVLQICRYYIYTMMYLELMRIHSVDMAFIYGLRFWGKKNRELVEKMRVRTWDIGLVASLEECLSVNHPGANARLERQARIEKELMQQNTQVGQVVLMAASYVPFRIIYMEASHAVTGTALGRQYGRSFAQGPPKASIPRAFKKLIHWYTLIHCPFTTVILS